MAATDLGGISVQLEAGTADYNRKLKEASDNTADFADGMRKIRNVAAVAFAGLAGSITLVTRAANVQLQAEMQLTNAFRATGQAIDLQAFKDQASALQDVTTFGDETTLAMQGLLGRFGQSQKAIMQLTPLIQDMAAATGTDLKPVVFALGRALSGSAGALSRYGITLTEAQKKTIQMGSDSERLAIITAALKSGYEGAAQTMAKTAVGAFKQLTNAMGDTQEEMGKILETPLAAIFQEATGVVKTLNKAIERLNPTIKTVGAVATIAATGLAGIVLAVTATAAVLPAVIAGMKVLAATVLPAIAAAAGPVAGVILGVAAALLGVVLAIGFVRRAWDANVGAIQDKANDLATTIETTWTKILKAVKGALDDLMQGFSDAVVFIASIVGGASMREAERTVAESRKVGGVFTTAAGTTGGEALAGASKAAKNAFDEMSLTFKTGVNTFGDAIRGVVGGLGIFQDQTKKSSDEEEEDTEKKKKLGDATDQATDALTALGAAGGAVDIDAIAEAAAGAAAGAAAPGGAIDIGAVAGAAAGAPGAAAGAGIGEIIGGAAEGLAMSLGAAGGLLKSAVDGFAAGGVGGAIVGAFSKLITMSKSFQQVIEVLNSVVGDVVKAIEPVLGVLVTLVKIVSKALAPVIRIVGTVLKVVGDLLGALFEPLGVVTEILTFVIEILETALAPVLTAVSIVFGFVAAIFGTLAAILKGIANFFIDAATELLKLFPGTAAMVERLQKSRFKIERDDVGAEITKVWDTFVGNTKKAVGILGEEILTAEDLVDGAAGPITDLKTPIENLGAAADKTAAALLNVPTGVKIALLRFGAVNVGAGGMGLGLGADVGATDAGADAVGNTFNIERVEVVAGTPEQLAELLEERARFNNFATSGTPANQTGRFTVPQTGT